MASRSPRIARALWIALAVLLLLLAGAFVYASVWIKGFLRSEEFRQLVDAKTGAALHAEATYGPLQWVGSSVHSDSLQATGLTDSPVASLRADQIRAEVNWRAIWDGAWRIDKVDVISLDATFRPSSGQTDAEPALPPKPSGLESYLPRRFELGQLNASNSNLKFLGAGGVSLATITGVALKVTPDGDGWAVAGSGGKLTLPMAPVLDITSFRTRLQNATCFVNDAQFRLGASGKISAMGEFSDNSKLQLEWDHVDINPLLGSNWSNRLHGIIEGTSAVAWPKSGILAGTAKGKFKLTEGRLENLQILEQIATFTGAPQFRRMPLQEVSGTYEIANGSMQINALVLESKGLLRVEGSCKIGLDQSVNGTFQVGVTPQTLQWLPGSRERVFTVARDGYLWTSLRLGGTAQNLQEDLSARLAGAMKDQVIDTGLKTLEAAPPEVKKGAKDLIDTLMPLLPVPLP